MLGPIFDLIFPPRCVRCLVYTGANEALCSPCFKAIKINSNLFCVVCRARIPLANKICHFDAPALLGAAADYADPTVKALIHALKFQGVQDAAKPLGVMISKYIVGTGLPVASFCLSPVPLGSRRRRIRGYNQAALIAEWISANLGLPLEPSLLKRVRDTKPQTELDASERKANVSNCFAADPAAKGRKIFLIDDVVTSGATITAAAKALKAQGAKKVIALAAAKA